MTKAVKGIMDRRMLFILIAMIVVISVISDAFMTPTNLASVLYDMSVKGIVAVGMSFLLLSGEIDMSVGYVLSCGAFAFIQLNEVMPFVPAMLIAVAIGSVFGLINGFFVAKLKIASFVVTLATQLISKTVSLVICGGNPLRSNNAAFKSFGAGRIAFIPYIFLIFLAMIFVSQYIYRNTSFGRNTFAVGGNAEYASKAGINVVKNKIILFVIADTLAAFAGVMYVGRMGGAAITIGDNICLPVIAGAVIGGNQMTGGTGDMLKTLIGIGIMSILTDLLNLMHLSSYIQTLITGLIVVFVVGGAALINNRRISKES